MKIETKNDSGAIHYSNSFFDRLHSVVDWMDFVLVSEIINVAHQQKAIMKLNGLSHGFGIKSIQN